MAECLDIHKRLKELEGDDLAHKRLLTQLYDATAAAKLPAAVAYVAELLQRSCPRRWPTWRSCCSAGARWTQSPLWRRCCSAAIRPCGSHAPPEDDAEPLIGWMRVIVWQRLVQVHRVCPPRQHDGRAGAP
eukprot:620855-Pyramimonas_sp.AAC.1